MIEILQTVKATASASVIEKAAQIAQNDPHGLIITVVSVSLVFTVLFILFLAYSISGSIFTGKFSLKKKCGGKTCRCAGKGEEAAAVAVALNEYFKETNSGEVVAAISAALHMYMEGEGVHDFEPGIITIKR